MLSNEKLVVFTNLSIQKNYYVVIYKNIQLISNFQRIKDKHNIFVKKRDRIVVNKSTKLAIFLKNLVSRQESNNNENKNNVFFENKSNKEAIKKKAKIKKATKNKTKNNKRKSCNLKKKDIKKIKKKIVLIELNILVSFKKKINFSAFNLKNELHNCDFNKQLRQYTQEFASYAITN